MHTKFWCCAVVVHIYIVAPQKFGVLKTDKLGPLIMGNILSYMAATTWRNQMSSIQNAVGLLASDSMALQMTTIFINAQ